MKRIHLFEFEDLEWFPTTIRNYGTDFLQYVANTFDILQDAVPLIDRALRESGSEQILDLASGGGGGQIRLSEHLRKTHPNLKVTLSDYYPNLPAFEHIQKEHPHIGFHPESVDARNVPASLKGFRTQLLSFHHFRPEDAKKILQNAVDSGSGIAILEVTERSLPGFLPLLFSPISVALMTPFIRPFRWGRLLFTYLIPIVPLFAWWDGIASGLRTYSVKEMQDLIEGLRDKEKFHWETGRMMKGPRLHLYLVGWPKKN